MINSIHMAQRKIIHIDMDAFFASVEQRDNPGLRGKPVAVGGSRRRGVVAAASYEARQFGVYSAMPSVIAQQKCPGLIFVKPNFDVYKAVSAQIREIFHRYTDLVEPLSLDEAFLDVTQNKMDITIATDIAHQIKQRIRDTTGLTASAGVSMNKFLAKIASDVNKPDGLFVIKPHQAQAFIEQLPIGKFFGVGKVTEQKMKTLGIHNGADLRRWRQQDLLQHFGKAGQYFFDVAQGQDDRPVRAQRQRKSVGAESTFSDDLCSLDELRESLCDIAAEVAARVHKAGVYGRTITLKIKFSDFNQITRSHTLNDAICDEASLREVALRLLPQGYSEGQQVRLLGITLSNLQTGKTPDRQLPLAL